MMHSIDEYLEITREIIVKKSTKDFGEEGFNQMIQKQLRIDDKSIEVVLSSMDIIGDTQESIKNFCMFGLKNDTGEKYIRLYGILNSIYLHSQAVIALARFFKVNDIDKLALELSEYKILHIRHKLGAHSVNYKDEDGTISCYTPIRMAMEAESLTFYNMNPQSNEYEIVNLYQEIDRYLLHSREIIKLTAQSVSSIVYGRDAKDKLQSLHQKINKISSNSKELKCQPTSV